MSDQPNNDIDLPWYQKIIMMGVVCLIFALIWWGYVTIFGKPSEQEVIDQAISACGNSRLSYEADCPEPSDEYDSAPTPGY